MDNSTISMAVFNSFLYVHHQTLGDFVDFTNRDSGAIGDHRHVCLMLIEFRGMVMLGLEMTSRKTQPV